jgi:predicted small lipoprotein YifL
MTQTKLSINFYTTEGNKMKFSALIAATLLALSLSACGEKAAAPAAAVAAPAAASAPAAAEAASAPAAAPAAK